MKQFKSTLPDGVLKFDTRGITEMLGTELWDALQGLIDGYKSETEGFILTGGTVAGISGAATITASVLVLNGKIMRLPSGSALSYPFYIKEAATTEESWDYYDGGTKPTINIYTAETAIAAPGTGQYITISAAGEYAGTPPIYKNKSDEGNILRKKVYPIGDWNMDVTASVTIAHGLSDITKIRNITVMIIGDTSLSVLNLIIGIANTGTVQGGYTVNTTNITLSRRDVGNFDTAAYSAIPFNRGFVYLEYEE